MRALLAAVLDDQHRLGLALMAVGCLLGALCLVGVLLYVQWRESA